VKVPDKRELKRFCEIDGWEETNPENPDHHRYKKTLDDGTILRTKVSHGRGPVCDDNGLWNHIRRDQMGLDSDDQFWEVLSSGKPAPRGEPEPEPAGQGMDPWLVDYLMHRMGYSEKQIRELTPAEAMKAYEADITPDIPMGT